MSDRNEGRASDRGRVYQASGDQHIVEHHHHGAEWSGPDSVRHPAVGRAPVVLRDRAELMERLRTAVALSTAHQVFVLHGLGGCGKTAVAYTLFQYATTEAGRIGFWVNASEGASLRAGMLALAADRGASEGELMAARSGMRAAADLVWEYLDGSDQPWLLVLDNADDPAVLRDGGWLRTSPRGTVVVTTRQAAAHWWPAAELLHVGVLPRAEAAQVLCDLAPGAGTADEAAAISDRLGRLPLALTLAGGFLAHQVIQPWTMTEYGRRLDGEHGADAIDLIDQGSLGTGHDSRHLVSKTWQLSLDSLTDQGIPEATHLLRLLACYSNDPLPLSVLADADLGPDLPATRVELALRGLLDHSLTELVTSGGVRCIRTHGVLLDSIARTMREEQREMLVAAAVGLVTAALPDTVERGQRDGRLSLLSPHVHGLLQRAVDWSTADPAIAQSAAECALRLAISQHFTSDYSSALSTAAQAADMAQRRLGESHPVVLRLRQRVGRALFRLGRFEESETVIRRGLEDCEREFGAAALDTLRSCAHLAFTLSLLGEGPEARALLQRVVADRTTILGRSHPATLVSRLGLLEMEGVELEEEIGNAPALMEECHRELGPDHTITLAAEANYAYALFMTGRLAEALPRIRMSLGQHDDRYGPDYPVTLNLRLHLSRLLGRLGQRAEAVEQAEMVVDAWTRILGPSNPWTDRAKEYLEEIRDAAERP